MDEIHTWFKERTPTKMPRLKCVMVKGYLFSVCLVDLQTLGPRSLSFFPATAICYFYPLLGSDLKSQPLELTHSALRSIYLKYGVGMTL